MSDITGVETTLKPSAVISAAGTKEAPQGNFMMRFADGGEPVTLYTQGEEKCIRDERIGMGRIQREERAETPRFAEPLSVGSVLSLGENQTFLVSPASNRAIERQYPNSVFVKRIPLEDIVDENGNLIEGFNTLSQRLVAEGNAHAVIFHSPS